MSTRASAARPKRAGETFARTQHLHGEGPATKRARFDVRNPSALAPEAPEEDAILELDEIGKSGAQIKRNAVNIDGYASDSSNEGFNARAEAKARAAKKAARTTKTTEQEDENDMFADLEESFKDGDEDEKLSREGKKENKGVRFLEEDDIEGQVEGSKGGGHVSADFSLNGSGPGKGKGKARAYDSSGSTSSESEAEAQAHDDDVDEEVGAGGKKAHAPKLSAFNMKEELEEGRFDAHGNFVRRAGDPDAVHDTWLDGVSKKDRKRAREAEEKRAEEQRQRTIANDQILNRDALSTLITHLERGETVLEALARLGRGMEKKKPKWLIKKRPRKKDDEPMDLDEDQSDLKEDAATISRRQELDTVTGAADLLLTRGEVSIYEESREALTRFYRRETGDEWVDRVVPTVDDQQQPSYDDDLAPHLPLSTPVGSSLWDYRWRDGRDDGAIHGPYEHRNMVEWHKAGYFEAGIEIRRSGEGRDDAWSPFAN